MKSLKIFLSHISNESRLADILEYHITRDFIGLVHVFASSDQTSIPAGSKWLREVTAALDDANLHVVLASPDSIEQKWINFEAGAAHVRGVPIIPLCHSELTPAQLPVPLSESEGLVLAEESEFKRLYQAIANALGSDVPAVDFAEYSREVAAFEADYTKKRHAVAASGSLTSSIEIVQDPKALCISSEQFLQLGFENQLQKVIDAFPSGVQHTRVLDSMAVRHALATESFSIVHIAAFICARSGDLYFSDVNLQTGRPLSVRDGDSIGVDEFVALLHGSQTKLAVITSCNSLILATALMNTCHVVAAREMISPNQMAKWVEEFYRRLPVDSLATALNEAILLSGARMAVYARQPTQVDLRVARSEAAAATV